jgi:NADP-dependent 3-hydroxy acid dehydrogenase YdfG
MKLFQDRLALVTGASRGIGAAIAEALAREGAHVILTARSASGLEEVEDRIHAAGGSATIAPVDLTKGEDIGKLAVAIGERWESLDIWS